MMFYLRICGFAESERRHLFFRNISLAGKRKKIADKLITEISSRLSFSNNVGLNYLSLDKEMEIILGKNKNEILIYIGCSFASSQ